MARRIFALRPILPKLPFGFADTALFFGLFILIYQLANIGKGFFVEFRPPMVQPEISLSPRMLPYYAARSTLRMFVALFLSVLFSISYGYFAAKNKRAEQVLIPLLDILQSVPVLAFLTVVTDLFIGLFPGSLFGLELASIFAAFTAQAWNMTFSFYHSLITLPKELDDAAKVFRFTNWRRFISLEVPASMVGLVWNAMMSFGGGWFFVAYSEVISPTPAPGSEGAQYSLPGLGSYVAKAVDQKQGIPIVYASITILIIILIVDQFFWRPIVAWSEKFKLEINTGGAVAQSWVLDLLYDAKLPRSVSRIWRNMLRGWRKLSVSKWRLPQRRKAEGSTRKPTSRVNGDVVFGAIMGAIIVWACVTATRFVTHEVNGREILTAFGLGLISLMRVIVVLAFATVVWTPVGVYIGFHPRWAKFLQPVAQFLSSFPANFLFPLFAVFFLRSGANFNFGAIALLALGTQWYILFNSIAGAMSVPTNLREMAASMRLRGWLLWKKLIIPAIFPAWVTGAVTASGGAWNATILAEYTKWGNDSPPLVAKGLGSYLMIANNHHDTPRMVLGVTVMCLFVVGINRLVWRKMYHLAETKYRLG